MKIDDSKFLEICDLVGQQEIFEEELSELKKIVEETKVFGIIEKYAPSDLPCDLPGAVQIAVTPAFYLAYEDKDEAIQSLLSHFPLETHPQIRVKVCEGYALAHNYQMLEGFISEPYADAIFAIGKFLALGQNWRLAISLYRTHNFGLKQAYIEGFANGLYQIMEVKYADVLYHWLTEKLPDIYKDLEFKPKYTVKTDPFLLDVLKELHKAVNYNPLKLLEDSEKIDSHYGVLSEKAVAGWATSYVWFWKGPKSKSFLPSELFILIASFLCSQKNARF